MSLLDSLVAYWKFDEGTGTSAADATGNGHTGALTSAGWATGIIGSGGNFTGATQYVSIPSSTAFDSGGAWAFWLKTSAATNNVSIISRISASGSADGLNVYITGGKLALQAKYGTNNALSKTGTVAVNDGAWHYVVVNFSLSGTIEAYIDGVLDISGTTAHNWAFNSQAIRLGKALDSFWSQLVGSLDEIGIWSRALTSDEVTSLYNSGAGLPYDDFGGGGSGVTVEAISGSLAITGQTGSVSATANKTAAASSGSLSIIGQTGHVSANANVSIEALSGSLGISGSQGVVSATANQNVRASSGALSLSGQTPSVSVTANVSVRAQSGSLSATGQKGVATTSADKIISASAGTISLSGSTGSVDVTARVVIAANSGLAAIIGFTGRVSASTAVEIRAASGSVSLTGSAGIVSTVLASPTASVRVVRAPEEDRSVSAVTEIRSVAAG